jgi:hypothetical protein
MQKRWIASHLVGVARATAAIWLVLGALLAAYLGYAEDVARATRNGQPVATPGSFSDDFVSWASSLVPTIALAIALAVSHSRTAFGASIVGAPITVAFGVWILLNEPTQVGLGSDLLGLGAVCLVVSILARAQTEPEEDVLSMPPPTHEA